MIKVTQLNLIILAIIILNMATSCANLRVVSKYDSDNPVPNHITRTSYFWGLKQPRDIQTDPSCPSICIVTVRSSAENVFLAAITLGIVVPVTLEYQCCPIEPEPGEL